MHEDKIFFDLSFGCRSYSWEQMRQHLVSKVQRRYDRQRYLVAAKTLDRLGLNITISTS